MNKQHKKFLISKDVIFYETHGYSQEITLQDRAEEEILIYLNLFKIHPPLTRENQPSLPSSNVRPPPTLPSNNITPPPSQG